jgi:hypothetical protein
VTVHGRLDHRLLDRLASRHLQFCDPQIQAFDFFEGQQVHFTQ